MSCRSREFRKENVDLWMTRPASDRTCLRALIVLATIPTPAAAFAIASAYYTLRAAPSRAAAVRCGPRVTIYSVGKTKEAWLQTAIELYTTRLRSVVDIDCVWVRDDAALEAFALLCKLEGIIPALEPAHALAHVMKLAPTLPKDNLLVMNLCGRGDKDVIAVAERLGNKI